MVKKLLGEIGKKIFSGKGFSGKKGTVEMLEVKPADRSTEELRKIGKAKVSLSNTLKNLTRGSKKNNDLVEEIEDVVGKYSRKITGDEVKPSKKFDDIEKTVTDLETGEVEKFAKGGLIKGLPKLAKRGWK
jgi:hypothetical protein